MAFQYHPISLLLLPSNFDCGLQNPNRCACELFSTNYSYKWRQKSPACGYVVCSASTATRTKLQPPPRDSIYVLNEKILREHIKRESRPPPPNPAEAEKFIRLVREQQERGLQKLKGGGGSVGGYKVDPHALRPGDYVVHKKVGVGKFVSIQRHDDTEYVFITEYVFSNEANQVLFGLMLCSMARSQSVEESLIVSPNLDLEKFSSMDLPRM